jgi:microcystin degradation protein MlrC
MKIFAGGIATETNTFSPLPTGLGDFQIQRGRDALAGRVDHPSLDLTALWGARARAAGYDLVFGLMAWAQPAGLSTRRAYEALRDELLAELERALPVEIVLLNLHGAMIAEGYDDCEADLVRRVRALCPEAVVGVELDLHCHLTDALLATADVIVLYKEYPHIDMAESGRKLLDLCVAAHRGEIVPTMAAFDCRMMGFYPTTRRPMSDFVAAMKAAEGRGGVLSVSFGHGFPFGDVAESGARLLVITDDDPALALKVAEDLGRQIYAQRKVIGLDTMALPLDDALDRAIHGVNRPVVVADQSDNTGGGAPGDSTFALRWLIDRGAARTAVAIIHDPEAVKLARKVGEGATLDLRVGGKLSPASGDPLDLKVTVLRLLDDYAHEFPQAGTSVAYPLGDVAAVQCEGITIILGSERCQCFGPSILYDLGLNPSALDVIVVKSNQHFYGGFAPIAGEVIYMMGPGAVPPDPRLIAYKKVPIDRMYPWIDDPLSE